MPVNPTYPGVYVQEIPSGVRTIAGVSTSVGLFVGRAAQGPLNEAVQCLSYSDFERAFSADATLGEMPHQLKLFFMNGGSQCYVIRIANGAVAASVHLQTEDTIPTLTLTAKQAGTLGDALRVEVDYRGATPEATFNLTVYQLLTNAAGVEEKIGLERWQNLSMAPNSPSFAVDFINQNSALISASLHASSPAPVNGFSQSGLPVVFDSSSPTNFRSAWQAQIGNTVSNNQFQISIDGSRFVNVNLSGIDVGALTGPGLGDFQTQLADEIRQVIADAFTVANLAGTTLDVSFETGPTPGANEAPGDASSLLRFTSQNNGDIFIRPGSTNDVAAGLKLGSVVGGLEISAYANRRPAPTGISTRLSDPVQWNAFAHLTQSSLNQVTLPSIDATGSPNTSIVTLDLQTTDANDPLYRGGGVMEKLQIIRDAINNFQLANRRTFFWQASVSGYRLHLQNTQDTSNTVAVLATGPTNFAVTNPAAFITNVRRYALGATAASGFQAAGDAGDNGAPPQLGDYEDAFQVAAKEIDLFNLMILPQDAEPAQPMSDIYGPASVFCQSQRAFLIMDPPSDWTDSQIASNNVDTLRLGLVNDHSAVFYPRVTLNDNGLRRNVGPAGAVAGLMARIDSSRGVWKAPAGTEAALRGVVGLQYQFSDAENGVMNPRAVNTIRVFPNGIVNWGARTMDGDNDFGSEYKYIPVRRLALYIEESLFRGLKWVVFEPNDEPLWAQIRLNVGAYMHGLFRQGAFQGATPKDAYFVKCDRETTTQADRNLGIVNIVVGFAPLKPAEFVVLTLQQIAGQLEAA